MDKVDDTIIMVVITMVAVIILPTPQDGSNYRNANLNATNDVTMNNSL